MDTSSLVHKGLWPDLMVCDTVLRVLPDGRFVVLYMTGGQTEPAPDNYVAMCWSDDRGVTWSKPVAVLRPSGRGCCLTEVLCEDGVLTAHVQSHRGRFDDWHNLVITSRDGGSTWSEPETFAGLPARGFVRNTHRASWGEWIAPFAHYPPGDDPAASIFEDGSFRNAQVGVLISGDRGRSWQRSATVFGEYWAEATVTELRDGSLAMLIRRDQTGWLWRTDSHDRGRTWSEPVRTDIPNPGSKVRLWRLDDGRIALMHNPNPQINQRNPLSLWISHDDLRTWGYKRDFCTFPGRLSYPDGVVDADGGRLHVVFDYNRHDLIYYGVDLPPA